MNLALLGQAVLVKRVDWWTMEVAYTISSPEVCLKTINELQTYRSRDKVCI